MEVTVAMNAGKVHIFWEGHKVLQNLLLILSVCTLDKSKVEISQNFVAYSEYTNFMNYEWQCCFPVESTHSNSTQQPGRPVYTYLFGENKEWNSTDNLKIFGKVKVWKLRAALNFRRILRIKT